MSLFEVKSHFFNEGYLNTLKNAVVRNVFSRFGAYTRTTAQQSLRYRDRRSSPGQIPFVHRNNKFSREDRNGHRRATSPLKELIFFSYDGQAKEVIIGPAHFDGGSNAPSILEHGGTTPRKRNPRRRVRRLGYGGEIRLGGRAGKTTKKNLDGAIVTYAKLKTAAQVDRANRIQEQLYGPEYWPAHSQAERPFMGPAARKNYDGMMRLWAESVK